ncbi:MAG TPA: polysaccharide deacetylase family protein [Povalibacter sp.]|jgi:peptidoglycan-N-acetylglucosamine deacetylase
MQKTLVVALLVLTSFSSRAEKVAITFDDLPVNGSLSKGVSEADIVKRVLPILAAAKAPPSYGFINARKLESNPNGALALKLWMAGGQRVGNHTYSHIDLTKNSVADFGRDVLLNEPALQLLAVGDEWRWFRYPYLHEGDTLEKRHEMRKFLADHGYAIAQTTLDYEDYMWNSVYARCLDKGDKKAIEWLHSSYLETAAAYFDLNREMAQRVYGREINHVLLLHLGAFSPEILPALFELMKKKGFELVTLEEAQRDPAYLRDPDYAATNTGTLLEQHLDAKRAEYPPVPPKPRKQLDAICK